MLAVASGMFIVILAWVLVGAACLGWGALVMRGSPEMPPFNPAWQNRFWLGFSVLLGLLELWHLFLPVDWRATAVLLGGGIIIGISERAFPQRLTVPGWGG